MPREQVIDELHESLCQLANEVADRPAVSLALRRFADELPIIGPAVNDIPRRRRRPLRPLLYGALEDGWISGRMFDRLMIASNRAERALLQHAV